MDGRLRSFMAELVLYGAAHKRIGPVRGQKPCQLYVSVCARLCVSSASQLIVRADLPSESADRRSAPLEAEKGTVASCNRSEAPK